jgi:hypothetical protein
MGRWALAEPEPEPEPMCTVHALVGLSKVRKNHGKPCVPAEPEPVHALVGLSKVWENHGKPCVPIVEWNSWDFFLFSKKNQEINRYKLIFKFSHF